MATVAASVCAGAVEDHSFGGQKHSKRETWSRQIDFLLACVGFSVGLGNVWRFPYLCYRNGGGAFLIPYFLCAVVGGIPLFFLEVTVGQFMGKGGVGAWKICPILQGIGWATTSVVFYVNVYYNVILAWAFYFLFASFTTHLPWDTCDNYWNTKHCSLNLKAPAEVKVKVTNVSSVEASTENATEVNKTVLFDPTTEFWENKVLHLSDGIHNLGSVKWDLMMCLMLAWFVVYVCICKGIKSSGKVMYFTATSPYVLMLILLCRGCTLPGALDGIVYYLVPNFSKLKEIQVWIDAGTQIFFSYAIALGGLTALGSYNRFNHNCYRDTIIFACTNSFTSLFAGFVIFSNLGFMAHQHGTTVDKVAESGPGLAFIAYPKAVSQMPVAPLWSGCFFFMIILLGLDSQFVAVEGFITSFVDTFPRLREGHRRELFTAASCAVKCLAGIVMVTNGGMYVFQLFDYYPASRIILLVALFELLAVPFIYGVNRFYDNIEMMLGFRISPFMKIAWVLLSPVYCMTTFMLSAVTYSNVTYKRPSVTYRYPHWAISIGWLMALSTVLWIPLVAVYKVVQYSRKGKPLRLLIQPSGLKPHQLRPEDRVEDGASIPMNSHYTASGRPASNAKKAHL